MIGYPIDSHVTYDEAGVPVYDRAVSSVPLRKLIKMLFSDGVMPNPSTNLQVAAGTGMNVVVKPGFAICNGCMKLEEEQGTIAVQAADASYDRIDTIVLRLDDNDAVRSCELAVLTGTPSTNPTRPALTRNASVWEIGLADIKISANSTAVTNVYITDTRYETARCGVISSISEFDTTKIYQQVLADLAQFKLEEQADFLAWFAEMKNQLSTDAAGNLQNQIDVERERINNLAKMEEGSTTGDAELRDIRVGANGIVYGSAGEAVREQLNTKVEKEKIRAVREDETIIGCYYKRLEGHEVGDSCLLGETVEDSRFFAFSCPINKGEVFALPENMSYYTGTGYSNCIVVVDENLTVVDVVSHADLNVNRRHTFSAGGTMYVSSILPEGSYDICFYLKTDPLVKMEDLDKLKQEMLEINKPLVLNEESAAIYLIDSTYGDETLNAILSGRQILVKVPNASGDNYVASYSPVYMYQLPNNENDYLYLFYLKDEKETIDLSENGAGKVEMPVYGQLKMLLSKTYNADPLR